MIGRHDANVGVGDGERVVTGLAIVQQFGDAEIKQFGHSGRRHQDVRGFEIPMHDEVLMGVMHRGTNDLKQLEPGRQVETVRITEGVDGEAIDVLHDNVDGSVRQGAAVQEMRDIRMIELGQDLTLDFESGLHSLPRRAAVNHLDSYLLLELGISALGEQNLSHTADAQGAQYAIVPYTVSDHYRSMHPRTDQLQTPRGPLRRGTACVYESSALLRKNQEWDSHGKRKGPK